VVANKPLDLVNQTGVQVGVGQVGTFDAEFGGGDDPGGIQRLEEFRIFLAGGGHSWFKGEAIGIGGAELPEQRRARQGFGTGSDDDQQNGNGHVGVSTGTGILGDGLGKTPTRTHPPTPFPGEHKDARIARSFQEFPGVKSSGGASHFLAQAAPSDFMSVERWFCSRIGKNNRRPRRFYTGGAVVEDVDGSRRFSICPLFPQTGWI
jgi:hypothetical protein